MAFVDKKLPTKISMNTFESKALMTMPQYVFPASA